VFTKTVAVKDAFEVKGTLHPTWLKDPQAPE
jgi:hypothetical protein